MRAKVLHYGGTGLCLYRKRLEAGRFASLWERSEGARVELTMSELALATAPTTPWRKRAATDPVPASSLPTAGPIGAPLAGAWSLAGYLQLVLV